MRKSFKYLPVLLLGTAVGGCSMAGTGDYFADEYAHLQRQQMPQYHSATSHNTPPVAYPVQTSTPDAHAYGRSVQGHPTHGNAAYGAPAYHGPRGHGGKGLRQAYTYGEIGATAYDVNSELFGGLARFGYQSKSIFGAEVEGTVGFSDDSATVLVGGTPFTGTIGVKNSLAGFGLARAPLSSRFNVLGRVGYHNSEIDGEITDAAGVVTEADFSVDGLAYGVGAEYAFSPKMSIRADYTIYDYDGPDADGASLTIARKF